MVKIKKKVPATIKKYESSSALRFFWAFVYKMNLAITLAIPAPAKPYG